MYTPETSKHFEKYVDPVTGAVSYILKTHVAAQQQSFYFVNPAANNAGSYLWFMCAFPPAMYATLAVVDFTVDEVRLFPETEMKAGPLVDLETGECIYAGSAGFYRRSPLSQVALRKICDIPDALKAYGPPSSLGTHLTYTPDKNEIFVDARSGDRFIAGTLSLKTGEFTVWKSWDFCRNHGQMCPTDGNLALMAEDFWTDITTNTYHLIRKNEKGEFMRLWTLTRDGEDTMHPPLDMQRATHEWWSRDGKRIYYCKYTPEEGNNGVVSLNLETGEHKVVAPVRAWHAFSSAEDRVIVFDENETFYRGTPSRVGLYNAETGKSVYIVSQNPPLAPREKPSRYHLDPHPQLVMNERYVSYTTAVYGRPDVALAPVEPLLAMTR